MVEPKRTNEPPGFPSLQSEVDKMFLELLRGERARRYGGATLRPNADVYFDRRRRVLVVKLELAGIDPAEIDLEISEGVLRVSGNRVDTKHPDAVYQQMEINYGRFERTMPLPPEVDPNKASADFTNGFLEIQLPLKEHSGKKRIHVATADGCVPPDDDTGDDNADTASGKGGR